MTTVIKNEINQEVDNNVDNVDQQPPSSQYDHQQPNTDTDLQAPILEGRRTLRKNAASTRGNYWSTMKALSSEDNTKRFGPFSIGSNSASSSHDDIRENNPASESHSDDEISGDEWSTSELNNKAEADKCENLVLPKQEDLNKETKQEFGEDQLNSPKENIENKFANQPEFIPSQFNESDDDDDDLDEEDSISYEAQPDNISDINVNPPGEQNAPIKIEDKDEKQRLTENSAPANESNIWTLPADRNVCTLEEIRRGQVINKIAPNQCPVLGCGKKINENRIEPSPGTIASGLRTHVLFVHYANRKVNKKRKLGWTKRRSQPSPKKLAGQPPSHLSPSTSNQSFDLNNGQRVAKMSLLQQSSTKNSPQNLSTSGPNANKKARTLPQTRSPALQLSSLQSLMQVTGARLSPQSRQNRIPDTNVSQASLNPTTSSLFSILAGLTQQQQQNIPPQQVPTPNDLKVNHTNNTISVTQCSRTPSNNPSRPTTSSTILSLLNENLAKGNISGTLANALRNQLKKSLAPDGSTKKTQPVSTQNNSISSGMPYYQQNNNDLGFNDSSYNLNTHCSGNSDSRLPFDNSLPLNSFIESIALRTGSNIGTAGIAEAKKIIEKFITSLICSSQTIADHYLAPFAGEVPQQKPEISPSDVVLAYKMMQKSLGQP